MRFYKVVLIVLAGVALLACANEPPPSTPLRTLEAYINAFKKKDITSMKILLSEASIKMAEQQARDQGLAVDDIVKNETLFTADQKTAGFRNQKIEGERATIEVKNAYGTWDTVPFVLEDGIWKIDKPGIASQMMQQNEQDNKELDDRINQGRIP
ncbi:MAG: hypothetical protein WA584_11915 [Pyrinomonadaceae bacterium]